MISLVKRYVWWFILIIPFLIYEGIMLWMASKDIYFYILVARPLIDLLLSILFYIYLVIFALKVAVDKGICYKKIFSMSILVVLLSVPVFLIIYTHKKDVNINGFHSDTGSEVLIIKESQVGSLVVGDVYQALNEVVITRLGGFEYGFKENQLFGDVIDLVWGESFVEMLSFEDPPVVLYTFKFK